MDYGNYGVICTHMRNLLKKNKIESIGSSIQSKPRNRVIWTILAWVTEEKCIDITYFKDGKLMCTLLEEKYKINFFTNPNEVINWIDETVEAE